MKKMRIIETCVYTAIVDDDVTPETCEAYLEENDCWPDWLSPDFVKDRVFEDAGKVSSEDGDEAGVDEDRTVQA